MTLLLLGTYTVMVIQQLRTAGAIGITDLPPLSARLIELLAVSHAGYLAYKAVPKAGSGGAEPGAPAPAPGPDKREQDSMPAPPPI